MSVLTLQDSQTGSLARIAVDRGFNCFEFKANLGDRVVDVLDSQPGFETGAGRPSGNGIPLLFPYPNRIKGGRYVWDGREYVISPEVAGYDRTGNAIHGFCIDRPWRVIEQTQNVAIGEFQLSRDAADRRPYWPSDCLIRIKYIVRGATLRAEIEIVNPDTVPMPWGFGTHPYFKLPLSQSSVAEQCLVVAPVQDCWELFDCLPSGKKTPLPADLTLNEGEYFGKRAFDSVFTAESSDIIQCSILDERAGLQITQSNPGHYPELVIYTPPNRPAICFEPYTCVTDAINLDKQGVKSGWNTLQPGETFRSWIDITAGTINV
jgi:aldose 1-epimerase